MGRICRKRRFLKSGMKERVGDEKLIIINVAVRGINDHIMPCESSGRFFERERDLWATHWR